MDINIKGTIVITSKKLFVIVAETEYDNLVNATVVFDKKREISFQIFSIEYVSLSGFTFPCITLKYETKEELNLLSIVFKDWLIVA